MTAPHARSAAEVLDALHVQRESGLDRDEVERRRGEHGPNELREVGSRSVLRILVDQFASVVIIVLVVAALLAAVARQWPECVAIVAVLAVNAGIGFVSEWRARRSMAALRALGEERCRVVRAGAAEEIPVAELVPGDIVRLGPEDVAPADLRLLQGEGLRVNEAALTGESVPVTKTVDPVDADTPLAERTSLLFKGTTIVEGEGEGAVVATGAGTEIGRISALADEAEAAETPLEKRLDRLGRRLAVLTLALTATIAVVGLAAGRPALQMLETAVALGVAAIPEGLPIVATLALARGMWLMAQRQAVVRRLSAVETLGATQVIFTDKTGTLTRNLMELRRIATAAGEWGSSGPDEDSEREPDVLARRALEIAVLCSNAELADEDGRSGRGDPMEVALLEAGADRGLERGKLLSARPELREVDFDPDVKMMATFHGAPGNPVPRGETPGDGLQGDEARRHDGAGGAAPGGIEVAVKGAAAAVIEACDRIATEEGEDRTLSDEDREGWIERGEAIAAEGLRVLAVADKWTEDVEDDPYVGLRFVGLVGLMDPPRAGVREAIEACRAAGVRVVVVTGDHPETARAIAAEVGVDRADALRVVHGRELPEAGEPISEELRQRIAEAQIFARLGPAQKLDLVAASQEQGRIVAMTGDGVNDAPALKKADIGIAMGRRGTDAAREVADIVLRDDAFSSIEAAVEQGRIIFANIRKATMFMLCTNVAEIMAVGAASFLPIPLPLTPLQILYLNVLTDVLPALALSVGRGDPGVMRRPPRDPQEPILTRAHWAAITGWAAVIAVCVLGALVVTQRILGAETEVAITASFLTLGLAKLWFVFNLRDPGSRLLTSDVVRNRWVWIAIVVCVLLLGAAVAAPGLSDVLETRVPDGSTLAVVLGLSLVPMGIGQALRAIQARRARRPE